MPLGRTVTVSGADRQLVGVIGNVQAKQAGWGNNPEPLTAYPTVYVPAAQLPSNFFRLVHTWFSPSWVVRYRGPEGAVAVAIGSVFCQVDPLLPAADVRPATEILSQFLAQESFQAFFLLALAGVSLLLAAVGLYGLVASSVIERTQELGIRVALGLRLPAH